MAEITLKFLLADISYLVAKITLLVDKIILKVDVVSGDFFSGQDQFVCAKDHLFDD